MERDSTALELCPGLIDRWEFTLLLLRGRGDCSGAGMSRMVPVTQHQEKESCLTIDHTRIFHKARKVPWYRLDDYSG